MGSDIFFKDCLSALQKISRGGKAEIRKSIFEVVEVIKARDDSDFYQDGRGNEKCLDSEYL